MTLPLCGTDRARTGGFLPALKQSNVTLCTSAVERVTEDSIITADGQEHKVDVLVCATGFDTSFKPRFEIRGRNNADMRQQWDPSPQSCACRRILPSVEPRSHCTDMSALVHNFPVRPLRAALCRHRLTSLARRTTPSSWARALPSRKAR
jgi:hypothetical protein